MTTIVGVGATREIPLATRKGNRIPNWQSREMSVFELNISKKIENDYRSGIVKLRNNVAPFYNCYGMTFASRRTCLEVLAVNQIIDEDEYEYISADQVLAGDVILYFNARNTIIHSGIVLKPASETVTLFPLVLSKWGRAIEVIHWANLCPYEYNVKYIRIKDEEPIIVP